MAQAQGMATRRQLQGTLNFARPGILSPALARFMTVALSFLGIALLLISLRPFAAASLLEPLPESGDSLNQAGFLAAGAVCALGIVSLANPKALRSLLSPGWLLLALVVVYSISRSPDQMATARSLILTVIGMVIAFAVLVLPRGEKDFRLALTLGALAVLALSYGGLVLLRDYSTHGFDAYEPQHSGLWRGHFAHKNIAGPAMSVITIFGIYIFRSGDRFWGAVITALGFLFVINTGSKTTTGFLPVAILIVLSAAVLGRSWIAIVLHLAVFACAVVLTLGSVDNPPVSLIVGDILGDATYTGRTTLWRFGMESIPEKLWLGFGYDNFWGTINVLGLDRPLEAEWDFRRIVHGHNNYIDIVLNMGVLGGGVVIWVLFVAPLFNYARARRRPGNRALADMFMMIIVFLTLLSLLETFYLRRVDPIWTMHALAVLGLHLLARFDIAATQPGLMRSR